MGPHIIDAAVATPLRCRLVVLKQFKWEVLDHPPYSPDLAPSDFHLFRYLKSHLGGKSFHDDDEIKDEVEKCGSDNRRQPSMTLGYKSLCTDLTNVWIPGVITSKNNK
ncbi:histone-lysine N-methyltransferase SETMAR [Trichonephila clavipes]|nr:histone-lysine N-methyltransferase SETMAR [Trichonephila clavipes]